MKRFQSKHLILAIIVPVMVFFDQLTKILAKAYLDPMRMAIEPSERYITVMDGFFRLKYAENPGAAFGLGGTWSPGFRVAFFIVVSLVAIGFILWIFRKLEPKQKLMATAVSLVLAGALGNLIDRIYMNKVVDFIDWYVTFDSPTDLLFFTAAAGEHHWPTFNIADIAISLGVACLFIEMIFGKQPEEEGKAEQDQERSKEGKQKSPRKSGK